MADININHEICRIRQPSANSCWAACLVMFCEAARMPCYTIQGVTRRAQQHGVILEANGSLNTRPENMARLQSAFRMRILPNRGVVHISHLLPYLNRAPLIIFGAFNYSGNRSPMNHAVIMGGMWGDGSPTTAVSIIDPQRTQNGYDAVDDDVLDWRTFCTQTCARLDYVGALG